MLDPQQLKQHMLNSRCSQTYLLNKWMCGRMAEMHMWAISNSHAEMFSGTTFNILLLGRAIENNFIQMTVFPRV